MKLAYVQVGKRAWSIAQIDLDGGGFEWWTDSDGWVSPQSSHWAWAGDTCWNRLFPSLREAQRFARDHGWEDR